MAPSRTRQSQARLIFHIKPQDSIYTAAIRSTTPAIRYPLRSTAEGAELTEDEQSQNYFQFRIADLGSLLKGTNIFFVGMMGTGKTAVARRLADKLGRYSFLDTDEIIEQLLQAPISKVFEEDGEEAFRSVEAQVLSEVHTYIKMVVSTGGGIVKDKLNWGKLQTGLVVWLDMNVEDIVKRLSSDPEQISKRPLLQGGDAVDKMKKIFEERKELYEQADVRVPVGPEDTIDDVVLRTVDTLHTFIESNPPKWQTWKDSAKASGISWIN